MQRGTQQAAKVRRGDGVVVLDTTQGYWAGGPNKAASDHELAVVGQQNAYMCSGAQARLSSGPRITALLWTCIDLVLLKLFTFPLDDSR